MTGTRSSATVRHSVSSQKHMRSASEPPPRATMTSSTSSSAASSCTARRDPRGGVAVLHRGEGPDHAAAPAAAPQAGEHVVARLAALAGHDADRARQQRARQRLLRREQPLGGQPPAQALDLGQQVALAGHAQVGDVEARSAARPCASPGRSRSRRPRRPARRRPGAPSGSPSASKSVRHMAQGSAPPASRSSKKTRAREARQVHRPRRRAARGRSSRSRSRSRAAYSPTPNGPGQLAAGDAGREEGLWFGHRRADRPLDASRRSGRRVRDASVRA